MAALDYAQSTGHASDVDNEALTSDEWVEVVGQHVRRRRQRLGYPSIRSAALSTEGSKYEVSEGAWRPIESGRRVTPNGVMPPRPSDATRYGVASVLRWPPDFIELLAEGVDPDTLAARASANTEQSIARHPSIEDETRALLHETRGRVHDLDGSLVDTRARVKRLEERLDALTSRLEAALDDLAAAPDEAE